MKSPLNIKNTRIYFREKGVEKEVIKTEKLSRMKRTLAKALAVALIASSVATVGPGTTAVAAAKPSIAKKVSSILVGKKYDLNIKNKITGSTHKWTTSDKSIATVSKTGIVTGIKKGTVTITCTATTPDGDQYILTNKIAIRQPATSVKVSNKITTVNVGQSYDFNRTMAPKTSNDLTSWTSSDTSIAKVNKAGIVTALKEGTVTITAKTLSGKTDKVALTVVDKEGLVATEEELVALLGSGAELITFKTDKAISITIPEGDYKDQNLVVDAPNAEVTNKGEFKSIEIKAIKENTWHEEAEGNTITVTAGNARVVVSEGASLSIVVKNDKAVISIVNNGVVDEITVDSSAIIAISGTSTKAIPVTANVADATIRTSVPLNLVATEKINLTLEAGAETTKIAVESEAAVPTITGSVTIDVKVGLGDDAVTKPVIGTPATSTGGYVPSPSPTSTSVIVRDVNDNGVFTLPVAYTEVSSILVRYNSDFYYIDGMLLTMLEGFLSNSSTTINLWKSVTSFSDTYGGQQVSVVGTSGSATKTVTFDSKSYTVTVNGTGDAATVSVTSPSNVTYELSKGSDNKTLNISNAPAALEFVVTY
jgi:hypothetical protein